MIYWLVFVFIFILVHHCDYGIEINDGQLQMVANSLKIDECRKLSESLHKDGSQLDHRIAGSDEPRHVSCLRLLQQQKLDKQIFHQRLRDVGRADLANRLSRSVDVDKTTDENLLDIPYIDLPSPAPRKTNEVIYIILAALVILFMITFVVCRWCCCKSGC